MKLILKIILFNLLLNNLLDCKMDKMLNVPTKRWKDKKIKLSKVPQQMNKQMGVVNTIGVKPIGYELDGDIKVFKLIAQPVEKYFTDAIDVNEHYIPKHNLYTNRMKSIKKKVRVWGYNGSMPGPTIEVFKGDRVRIIFKNELPEPSSIHWHGIELPNSQDGSGGVTEPPVEPGESKIYEFTFHQEGTFLYHSGFNMMKQDMYGLSGVIVVHPKEYKKKIDKDFVILLQEWVFLPGNKNPNLASMDFNWFTFNGLVAPSIPALTIKKGERMRIRFGNLSMHSHPIHIHGYSMPWVGTDGGPIPENSVFNVSTINIPPGATRDLEFVAWNPGIWRIHCHKLHHIVNSHAEIPMTIMPRGGMFTFLYVIDDKNEKWVHPSQINKCSNKFSKSLFSDKRNILSNTKEVLKQEDSISKDTDIKKDENESNTKNIIFNNANT
ncbi:multicopper oxidase domain-containing protein [Candidatus Dependentiae bacterium]|nr:multicopper oxidase domain-containing protein [Candidatus Dependentiae bacterium]